MSENKMSKYIKAVLKNIRAPRKMKNRIKEDLRQRIYDSVDTDSFDELCSLIGEPREVASEFMENIDYDYSKDIIVRLSNLYEYKSKKTFMGVPLIHINLGGMANTKVARGIIAIGDIAIGVVSLGGVSVGVISLGGVALAGVALGGVAIGGIALGGVALGLLGVGGVSYGILKAFGEVRI